MTNLTPRNLTPKEQAIIDILEKYNNRDNKILMPDLANEVNISQRELRKTIVFLRQQGRYPIISSSKGYFLSTDPEDIAYYKNLFDKRIGTTLNNISAMLGIPVEIVGQQLKLNLDDPEWYKKHVPKDTLRHIKRHERENNLKEAIFQHINQKIEDLKPLIENEVVIIDLPISRDKLEQISKGKKISITLSPKDNVEDTNIAA